MSGGTIVLTPGRNLATKSVRWPWRRKKRSVVPMHVSGFSDTRQRKPSTGRLARHGQLEAGGSVRGEGAGELPAEGVERLDPLARRPEGAGERGEVRVRELRLSRPAVEPFLEVLDRAVTTVVEHEEDDPE